MASEIRNRFTDTEMQIARETDLLELLTHLGYQELKEYNFWRNLYGTKGIALVVYLLIIVREITLHGTIDIKIFF